MKYSERYLVTEEILDGFIYQFRLRMIRLIVRNYAIVD